MLFLLASRTLFLERVKKKKVCQLGIRLDEDFAERLREFEDATGIPQAALARAALEAALNFYGANGKITFPLRCVSVDTDAR